VAPRSILLAGGGTGGHIYPNVAIAEALAELAPEVTPRFLVSARESDAAIMDKLGYAYHRSPVQPLPSLRKPWQAIGFLTAWRRAVREVRATFVEHDIAMVIATGGFVSGPGIVGATRAGLPHALVNLDAVPGKANRRLVKLCPDVFTAYAHPLLPGATTIGLPMRAASRFDGTPREAKLALDMGLDPDRPLLFVTGATHGAESIVRLMEAWVGAVDSVAALDRWQVLHQCGTLDPDALAKVYADAHVTARVVDYLNGMGAAWRAADLAIARAGAGTVAEAWANGTATVFLPNPYHHDQHQRHNAQPMVDAGGAIMLTDHVQPATNLAEVVPAIAALLEDDVRREAMRQTAESTRPPDGARTVAEWIVDRLR
jgi:UDP-N-acetylglucosamine--N-acetylmuramyl-(pentapeptide) pyrophosphoryl-undecaprenol N-acetylglucosamine transferase